MPDDADVEPAALDTTITEPSLDADETEMLLFALERARAQFAWKVGGLDAEGLRRRHPPSASTLGGLVKHLAQVEDTYVARMILDRPLGPPWDAADESVEPIWEWACRTAADDSPAELYALWRDAVQRSRDAWAHVLAKGGLGQPSTYRVGDGRHPNLRRVIVDTIEEYQRHTGHADLLREAVDGLVGNDPPQS